MTQDIPIRVMIVDDHTMMRTGLKYTLESFDDLALVAEAGNGTEAVALCDEVQPDVILMDMVMPGMDGAEATKRIRHSCPQVQILALTSFQERDLVERALQAGAIGYLLKNVPADELAQAIRAAYTGRPTLSQEATEALIQSTRQKQELGSDLTGREREVLALMVKGLTNAQIADKITVSESTAKFHVRNILSKLGASNRAEAVNLAWQYKLVKETGPLS
jgi:NarL family two-component system response regulator LiaR